MYRLTLLSNNNNNNFESFIESCLHLLTIDPLQSKYEQMITANGTFNDQFY